MEEMEDKCPVQVWSSLTLAYIRCTIPTSPPLPDVDVKNIIDIPYLGQTL